MPEYNLSDEQWLVLDLLMRAKQRGVEVLNRMEVLTSEKVPVGIRMKLVFAALRIPEALVVWIDQHNFRITDEGARLYNLRFDNPTPSKVADAVICLPDLSQRH